jgi:hypothetical protein
VQRFVGFNQQPDWSPDGKHLAVLENFLPGKSDNA